MRRLLIFLTLALALGAFTAGTGTVPTGLTTMTFQPGVAPTSDYTGCAATYIASRAGAGNGANRGGCDTLNVSSSAGTYGQQTVLIKFDISDLPDDAVINRARLWLYQINPAGSSVPPSEFSNLKFYRCNIPWTEGAGTCAGVQNGKADWDSAGGGLAWYTAGTATSQSIPRTYEWISWGGTNVDSTTVVTTATGADTTTGYPTNSVAQVTDHPANAITVAPWRSGNTAAKRLGWVVADITPQVVRWHQGRNNNYGVVIKDEGQTATATIAFASDDYAWKLRRPKLVVDYVVASTAAAASGNGRRVLGGATGLH